MSRTILMSIAVSALLALGGCASYGDHPVDVRGAEITRRTIDNGDQVEEYRVAGQLRMIKVTPVRGATYYLYDQDGDGRLDSDKDGVAPVYWQIYKW